MFNGQISEIRNINDELDDMLKLSNSLAMKFKMRDSQMQVNQHDKTGELRSYLNYSTIPDDNEKNNNHQTKSIQASL